VSRAACDSNRGTYHIKVDKSIKSGKDFYAVLNALLGNYFMWREQRYIRALHDLGWDNTQIASKLGYSRQYISLILSKSSKLHLVDSENGKAPADERATALPSSLSTNNPTAGSTVAGQVAAGDRQLSHQQSTSRRIVGDFNINPAKSRKE
jgi:hypothetical protein